MTSNPTSEGLVERAESIISRQSGISVILSKSLFREYVARVAELERLLSEAADRIEALEGDSHALRERNRRLKEANDKEHHRLTGAKDKSRARAIRAEQANRELSSALTTSEALVTALSAQLEGAKEALRPFAMFNLSGFSGEFLEVVPSSPDNPARRIEPIWTSHFRLAASTLYGLETIDVSSVAGAEVAASTGVKSDSAEGH